MTDTKYMTLTKAEMQVMNILWNKEGGATVSAVIEQYPEPQPAYTTIATFLTILEKKGYVERRKSGVGKQFKYMPLITRQAYTARAMNDMKDNLFGGSAKQFANFFFKEEMLSKADIEELLSLIEKQ